MGVTVRKYTQEDIPVMTEIWNAVVDEGEAFPQADMLSEAEAQGFFDAQSYCGVAEDENGKEVGLYILHPNNVGTLRAYRERIVCGTGRLPRAGDRRKACA